MDPVIDLPSRLPSRTTRRIVAGIIGAIMCAMCIVVAWLTVASEGPEPMIKTRYRLMHWQNIVTGYRHDNKRFPDSLDEAIVGSGANPVILQDFWGQSLRYEHTETEFSVISLGRNGQAGGVGLDADISTGDLYPKEGQLTLLQFLMTFDTRSLWVYAVLSGLLAGGLAYREMVRQEDMIQALFDSAPRIVFFGMFAMGMAFVLAMAEFLPERH